MMKKKPMHTKKITTGVRNSTNGIQRGKYVRKKKNW